MYDPNKALVKGPRKEQPPYGDLYKIYSTSDPERFRLDDFGKRLTTYDIFPLRCERIFNNEFPFVRRAEWWLEWKYGADYMTNDMDKLALEKAARGIEVPRTAFRTARAPRGWDSVVGVFVLALVLLLSVVGLVLCVYSWKYSSRRQLRHEYEPVAT